MPFVRAVRIAVLVALLLALAAPAAAQADATVSVTGSAPHKTLTFTVADALDHVTTATSRTGELVIRDELGIAVGASGCTALDALKVNCGSPAGFDRVLFALGDGDDQLDLGDLQVAVSADGGAGNDVVYGAAGDDHLSGGPGNDDLYGWYGNDELIGGAGDDYFDGGAGADVFDGREGNDDLLTEESPPEADTSIACGPGLDTLVEDDLDELPDDCEALDPPRFDGSLVITGAPRVGSVLALSIPTNIGGDGVVTIQWKRCDVTGFGCQDIDGAHDATYTLTASDRGSRLRAWYSVENGLGYEVVASQATGIVGSALPPPPHHAPPTPHAPAPPRPPVARLKPALAPFVVARKPSFATRNGKPVVDTGRSIGCPSLGGSLDPCRLSVKARPSGASARLRGRPRIAGTIHVSVAAGARAKVVVPLNRAAYRLLRAHRKLTLSVTAAFTRPHYAAVRKTFVISVKAPGRAKH